MKTVQQRFNEKYIVSDSGCWRWIGTKFGRNGSYGGMRIDGRIKPAHRISYVLHKGDIQNGYEVDHLCHVAKCVNPEHLEAVTPKENRQRAIDTYRQNNPFCKLGHRFSGENLFFQSAIKRGRRYSQRRCRECGRIASRKSYIKMNALKIS